MRNEKDVKKEIKKVLAEFPSEVFHFMPVPTGYGVQGIPDFVCCVNGYFVGIEAKFGKNKESAWQKKQGAAIQAACGLYLVINDKNVGELRGTIAGLIEC